MTIWDKEIQDLLYSEDEGNINLAISLVKDSKIISYLGFINDNMAKKLGLPKSVSVLTWKVIERNLITAPMCLLLEQEWQNTLETSYDRKVVNRLKYYKKKYYGHLAKGNTTTNP